MMRPGSIVVTASLAVLAMAALAMSLYSLPTTLKVAVGPEDRDHSQLMAAFARKLQADRAPIRLTLVRKDDLGATAVALDRGDTQLAVVRSDQMPKSGQTVAVLNESAVLFVAPPGARVRRVEDLAGRRVGVARNSPENLRLLDQVLQQAGVDPARVARNPIEPSDAVPALKSRQVDALMLVGALDGSLLRPLRSLDKALGARPVYFGVDEAEAIAMRDPTLESKDIPRGALSGSPPVPAEELTTLAVSQRLVAQGKLNNAVVNDLTRLLFTSRLALAAELPAAKSIAAPDTDAGAALPLHPGAAQYLNGERNGFFDRYGDLFYIGSMLFTMVASGIGALLNHFMGRQRRDAAQFTHQVLDLISRARHAKTPAELDQVQTDADALLTLAFKRVSTDAIDGDQFATFAMLNDSVQMAIERRQRQFDHGTVGPPVEQAA